MNGKAKELIMKQGKWIIFAGVMIIAILIARNVFRQEIMRMDTLAYNIIVENLRTDWLTRLMIVITNLGGIYMLPELCIIVLILSKDKKIGIAMSANLGIIVSSNLLLKNIIQRPRPEGYRLIAEYGYSFPSGHSMVSTAFYGLIIYFIYKYIKNKKLKYTLCTFISLLIVLIGVSRVYLGVHYASDVIAGFLVSIGYLICFVTAYNAIQVGVSEEEKKKLINSFKYAFSGLVSAVKRERNLKIHITIMCLVIIAGFLLNISVTEWLICIVLFGIVISAELMNTAIEKLTDIAMPEIDPRAKFIKDVSASAVLVPAIASAIIGIIIFGPKIIEIMIK